MPLDRVKANELLELVVIDQSPKARELLLDKLEECVTPPVINMIGMRNYLWGVLGHEPTPSVLEELVSRYIKK